MNDSLIDHMVNDVNYFFNSKSRTARDERCEREPSCIMKRGPVIILIGEVGIVVIG